MDFFKASKRDNRILFTNTNANAYSAIIDLTDQDTKAVIECYGIIHACIWYGAATALGELNFNRVHNGRLSLNVQEFDTIRVHIEDSLDRSPDSDVPGDWLYMKNHNYREIIRDQKNNWRKDGLLYDTKAYSWSGENYLCTGVNPTTGELIYDGFGLWNSELLTEKGMRRSLMKKYNEHFVKLIKAGVKINGVQIEEITEATADVSIIVTKIRRIIP